MAADETRIELRPQFFDLTEQTLVTHGDLSATAFRYASGVEAVRLRNGAGSLVMLPFQGQQIWSAEFGGRELTMKSMFEAPNATRNYLETYGGFLLHCGATAMGVPAAGDTHPVHGELPNAPYQSAYVVVGADEDGEYIGLGGSYRYTVAFSFNYVAEPLVKMYAGASSCHISLTVKNLKQYADGTHVPGARQFPPGGQWAAGLQRTLYAGACACAQEHPLSRAAGSGLPGVSAGVGTPPGATQRAGAGIDL